MLPSISRDYEGPVRVIIADKYSVSVSFAHIFLCLLVAHLSSLFFHIESQFVS